MSTPLAAAMLASLTAAAKANAAVYAPPQVILWPDPERLWESVLPGLRAALPQLLTLGPYAPDQRQGPAIWLKCMVARALPAADWASALIPILYLPGIGKADLRQPDPTNLLLAPLLEYQYTGQLWLQESHREWTPAAFLQNRTGGLGRAVGQDAATKAALQAALPKLFHESPGGAALYADREAVIDEKALLGLIFPDGPAHILAWLAAPDSAAHLVALPSAQQEAWPTLLRSRYGLKVPAGFPADPADAKANLTLRLTAAEWLGTRRTPAWRAVWQYFVHAPQRFAALPELLRQARPAPAPGLFDAAVPTRSSDHDDAWPQVNDAHETTLRAALHEAAARLPPEARAQLAALEAEHAPRRAWVWAELHRAPLARAVAHLHALADETARSLPAATLPELRAAYEATGYRADQAMRAALASVTAEADAAAVRAVLSTLYTPWVTRLAEKFQALLLADAAALAMPFGSPARPDSAAPPFVLFVDALRYEVARELADELTAHAYTVGLTAGWAALPTVTPTAKPHVAPLAGLVSEASVPDESLPFAPRLAGSGKLLRTDAFRAALTEAGYEYLPLHAPLVPGQRYWQEIGTLDATGHSEGAGLVRRIPELLASVRAAIAHALAGGAADVRIVTDHGWLLVPGGLPKTAVPRELVETQWGRCALLKEGAVAPPGLPRLPWRWNPAVYVAYAPGISLFKAGPEYGHGGLSLHECLVPVLTVSRAAGAATVSGRIKAVKWTNLRARVETDATPDGCRVDLRTTPADPATSVLLGKPVGVKDNKATLLADDAAEGKSAVVVLLDAAGAVILDKVPTLVGG